MNYINKYGQYLYENLPEIGFDILDVLETVSLQTNWENPQTSLDWNNLGVVAIIEGVNAPTLEQRHHFYYLAISYFQKGLAHPLSFLHYLLLLSLIGEHQKVLSNAYSCLIQLSQPWLGENQTINLGLAFLPPHLTTGLRLVLSANNGYEQAVLFMGILWTNYSSPFQKKIRQLHLAVSLSPEYTPTLLKLGLALFYAQEYEGIYYLHQAQKQESSYPAVIQSLYLAYKKLQNSISSNYWKNLARDYYLATDPQNPLWFWSALPEESAFTYVLLQGNILLAVLPDLSQVVTVVLLADGDWLEDEMEFWVNSLQPGMTVIDVGANVGVYTFTAARAVGETGCVIAIEPFAPCITCLEETKRVNNFGQVVIKQAAASDKTGTVYLHTAGASEFNTVTEQPPATGVEVPAVTLDQLTQELNLSRVDVLKINAEGHELAVLRGAESLLKQHSPVIMYENINYQDCNTEVATYLQERGYKLYRYRPFLMQLQLIDNLSQLEGVLNVIARRE